MIINKPTYLQNIYFALQSMLNARKISMSINNIVSILIRLFILPGKKEVSNYKLLRRGKKSWLRWSVPVVWATLEVKMEGSCEPQSCNHGEQHMETLSPKMGRKHEIQVAVKTSRKHTSISLEKVYAVLVFTLKLEWKE